MTPLSSRISPTSVMLVPSGISTSTCLPGALDEATPIEPRYTKPTAAGIPRRSKENDERHDRLPSAVNFMVFLAGNRLRRVEIVLQQDLCGDRVAPRLEVLVLDAR